MTADEVERFNFEGRDGSDRVFSGAGNDTLIGVYADFSASDSNPGQGE